MHFEGEYRPISVAAGLTRLRFVGGAWPLWVLFCSLFFLPVGACRKPKARAPLVTTVGSGVELGIPELTLDLESTVLENYLQLSYANIEAFVDSIETKLPLQLMGITPNDVIVSGTSRRLRQDRRLYRELGPRILSKNLDVHLSQDGSTGWVFDEVSYRVPYMSRSASIPIRSTSVFIRDVERWLLVAEHQSYAIPIEELVALASREELVAGRGFKEHAGGSTTRHNVFVSLATRFLTESDGNRNLRKDALVLLAAPEMEYHDDRLRDAPVLSSIFGGESKVRLVAARSNASQSRRVGWLMANLVVYTELNGVSLSIPLRGSFVFEKTKQRWDIVQVHVSVPLTQKQIGFWVFGPEDPDELEKER